MRPIIRPIVTALSLGALALSFNVIASESGFAQAAKKSPAKQEQPATAPAPEPELKQIALTDKQIESVLAAQKDLDAITEKLPQTAAAKPDPKVVAQLDDVAKKNGFASYGEYNDVVENISLVLSGFDPQSKKYVGTEAVIKQQISALQADKKMPAKDKKEALAELNGALKSPPPAIENKGNIDLVGKYYDRLFAAMQDE
ncbi:hypothetical protein FNL55_04720 [Tardiphaga sp. vice352]|uniref:hypothetical protein n=1 Tax=unclassified Tardiphaga TaxID=2631404 RepID=UPI0011624A3C|nr:MULTISPECIES: hypothetical protein [unclassified Tardiphaga]MBC7582890.1 hypothetical protein [Tardiphaga sp.]QDM15349.1 hypothetical protein FNL53_04785 [Tardiphaga sp. vice278]QDM20432.1 hypothetical protein FIU28_04095 [Tardiphaga sp. vice154]QDM25518.1 hypothetical protein FNL56_04640 [Tardiphaga sp. vice304]QDM30727.1 hypothetical protein FNL55_04720 [Tardiphaga sp. vice352]